MILYVNGDEHTAAAKVVNSHSFANDDINFVAQGRRPHPDNLAVSWGMTLSKPLGLGFKCNAESESSNDRIIRTTDQFIDSLKSLGNPYTVVVIGWSRWEREEWYDEDTKEWYQISPTSTDWPDKWKVRHKQWKTKLNLAAKETEAHGKIHDFHLKLQDRKIPHLFFNAQQHFNNKHQADWNDCYLEPYDPTLSYAAWTKLHTLTGTDAQRRWADVLFSRLTPLLNNV